VYRNIQSGEITLTFELDVWDKKNVVKETLKELLTSYQPSVGRSTGDINPENYGFELMILRVKTKKPEIIDSLAFCHRNQIRLLFQSGMWVGTKKMELQANGIDLKDCRLVARHVPGTKRPTWLLDRISKQGVIVL